MTEEMKEDDKKLGLISLSKKEEVKVVWLEYWCGKTLKVLTKLHRL